MDITSRENARIKQVRSLRQRKGREAAGLFLVEGIRHVGEAADAAAAPNSRTSLAYVLHSPDLLTSAYALELVQAIQSRGTAVYSVSGSLFESLAEKDNPQGILAVVRLSQPQLSELNPQEAPWLVALVEPQDPGNIGAILRTIDAVGASGLLLLENSADPYHPAAVRASMGSLFWYPVVGASFSEFARWAPDNGYSIYGTSARGSLDFQQVKSYTFPSVLLMGSEREGLTPEQRQVCTQLVRLPMGGHVTSLNLAVATGVFLYDMLVKRE